jgi:hypothetical protein
VLQFNALLITGSSGSGVLQDHASDARSFCAALVCARHFTLSSRVHSAGSVRRISLLRFLSPYHGSAFCLSTHLLLTGSPAPAYLARPPVVSRLKGLVCLGIVIFAGG